MSIWKALKPVVLLALLNAIAGPFVFGLAYALIMGRSDFDPQHATAYGLPPILMIDGVLSGWAGYRLAAYVGGGIAAAAGAGAFVWLLGASLGIAFNVFAYPAWPASAALYWTIEFVASAAIGAGGGYLARRGRLSTRNAPS